MQQSAGSPTIAWWMKALNIFIIAILGFKTWATLNDPSLIFGTMTTKEPSHIKALWELAGRNLAMIALSLCAMAHPCRQWLLPVFVIAFVREAADMVIAASQSPMTAPSMARAAAFLLFLGPYALAIRRLLSGAHNAGQDAG